MYFLLTATLVELYLPMFWVVFLCLLVFVEDSKKKKEKRKYILLQDLLSVC